LCSILGPFVYFFWATRYYTENKNINNGPQNTTQKTKTLKMGHKKLHRKQKYKQ
jgi:hypothetical protein